MQLLSAIADPLDEVLPHVVQWQTASGNVYTLHIGKFLITNHMVMALIVAVLMLLIFPLLFNRPRSDAPHGARNLFESILEFLRVEVFRPALKENTDRFVPFLWTLFFFILFCNLFGCIPLAATIQMITGGRLDHFGGSPTANISITAALAICAFVFIHVHGIDQIARSLMDGTYGSHGHHQEHTSDGGPGHEAAHDLEHARAEALPADVQQNFKALTNPTAYYGDDRFGPGRHAPRDEGHALEMSALRAVSEQAAKMTPVKAILLSIPIYLWNFAPHPFRPKGGGSWIRWIPDLLMFGLLLLPLELLGAMVKPFALCVRLFANMVAGHVLLAVLIGLIVAIPTLAMRLPLGVPIAGLDLGIQLLEIFVAFLQAYIFTFLTTLFLASAVAPEH